ncbi:MULTISPECIES: hypothetical protein [unclassified Bradyrhizobium]|uniref:hypothetical protein n=1 Tax=unclassified Bradyrhizobium TaxID=2631580 RepID=UPI0024B17711|nr:hypothetical protein [Bradyrhizobium sp. CB2312]WFU75028.1 hypothetical protein QA642_13855 [Bradyrhizobium sp. CB2312]
MDALVELGHEVTLFASGDSRTRAALFFPSGPKPFALATTLRSECGFGVQLEVVFALTQFDVIHAHIDWLHLPLLCAPGTFAVQVPLFKVEIPSAGPIQS